MTIKPTGMKLNCCPHTVKEIESEDRIFKAYDTTVSMIHESGTKPALCCACCDPGTGHITPHARLAHCGIVENRVDKNCRSFKIAETDGASQAAGCLY